MRIRTANLEFALYQAIHALAEEEKKVGPEFKSGLRAGWEEVVEAIKRGEPITVSDE